MFHCLAWNVSYNLLHRNFRKTVIKLNDMPGQNGMQYFAVVKSMTTDLFRHGSNRDTHARTLIYTHAHGICEQWCVREFFWLTVRPTTEYFYLSDYGWYSLKNVLHLFRSASWKLFSVIQVVIWKQNLRVVNPIISGILSRVIITIGCLWSWYAHAFRFTDSADFRIRLTVFQFRRHGKQISDSVTLKIARGFRLTLFGWNWIRVNCADLRNRMRVLQLATTELKHAFSFHFCLIRMISAGINRPIMNMEREYV